MDLKQIETAKKDPTVMTLITNSSERRPYNLMCKDEQFLKVNQNWV